MASPAKKAIELFLSVVLLIGFSSYLGVNANQGGATVSASQYSFEVTARTLDADGAVVAATTNRTEYFATDGRERIEDSNSAGQVYLVQIFSPKAQTVTSINLVNQTYNTRKTQMGSLSTAVIQSPVQGLTRMAFTPVGKQTIGGFECSGFSAAVNGSYDEVWNCIGAQDVPVLIHRKSDGTGYEQRLQQSPSIVQIPAASFDVPAGFTAAQAP